MSTPHINANKGDFAKTILMPGDPLRAKFIAQTFLENVKEVTNVRSMLGFTGTYKGEKISVMGSGMGMPSIGIYSYELYTNYDVENIIRVGSAGSYSESAKIFDVVIANGAYSDSNYAYVQGKREEDIIYPSASLNEKLKQSAKNLNKPFIEGVLHSSDVFYRQDTTPYWQKLRDEKNCVAVEMESFALFHNASVLNKNAACVVTISDSFVTHKATTSQEREKSFTDMMEIALGTVLV